MIDILRNRGSNPFGGLTLQEQMEQNKMQGVCPHNNSYSFLFGGIDVFSGFPKNWDVKICKNCNKTLEQKEVG